MKKIYMLGLAAMACLAALGATRGDKTDAARSLEVFNSVVKELQLNYVDTIDIKKSVNTALLYMLDEIDPYTEYYPADDREQLTMISTGEYAGIGCMIGSYEDGRIYFSEPYAGTPSQLAGVRAGDLIIAIDGDSITSEWDTQRVSQALRGSAGTKVAVRVRRPFATDSIIDFTLERAKIHTPAVQAHAAVGPDGKTGYILLSSFTEKAHDEVAAALDDLIRNHGITSLVIDLQGNPGGLLESAVQIASLFVPKGTEIVRTRGRGALSEKVYRTVRKPVAPDMPLAILIDGGSASSSEILAGSLQDIDRAVIVGDRSFGKGLVQTSRQLPYDGMLKLTVAKYYIPSGRLIQAIDYSRRNEDGSVARTPDSLTTVYNTLHGRQVRDGGGITPDISSAHPQGSRLLYDIRRGNYDFDYATRFAATHPSIAPARDFVITDSIFADFKRSINSAGFKYDRVSETLLKSLREAAESEGYMTPEVEAQIAVLDTMLSHNLDHDLDHNREALELFLSDAIVRRYYFQEGGALNSLRYNTALRDAIAILSDPRAYAEKLGLGNAK